MTTLLMSSRHTEDNQALWRAAIGRGWSVIRARGIGLPEIDDDEVVIYVEALYAQTMAEMIGRRLLDLSEDWLVKVPHEFRRRDVRLITFGQRRGCWSDMTRLLSPSSLISWFSYHMRGSDRRP